MKTRTYINNLLTLFILSVMGISCNSESFLNNEGSGIIRMNVSMNSKITRGDISGDELTALQESCVVYISDEIGLLHKWQGLSNIPEVLSMKYDTYVAEAWAGDSVSASFDKKFYKGMTTFTVDAEHQSQNVIINCKIANVIGSVDVATIDKELIRNVVVTFSNSVASLTLNEGNLYNKGYFMMPDDDTELRYIVSGENINGDPFNKVGVVPDVKQGHEYRLQIIADPSQSTTGGAFFDIVVEEFNEQIDEELIIYGKPAFSWYNTSLGLDDQIVGTPGTFNTEILRVAAYNGGFKSLTLETQNMSLAIGSTKYDLVNVNDANLKELSDKGITLIKSEANKDGLHIWSISIEAKLLNSLELSNEEYTLNITAVDKQNKVNSMVVRIANSEAAITNPDPIIINFEEFEKDLTAVNATSARIPVTIIDSSRDLSLRYKKESEENWNELSVNKTRNADVVVVDIDNLSPSTTYQYQVVATAIDESSKPFESGIRTFKTESKFSIPNNSMEDWYKSGNIWEPHSQSDVHKFWDCGNHGTTLAGFTATEGSEDFHNTGSKSVKLETKSGTLNKMGAGNIFVGKFGSVSGLNGAKVNFGQEYDGSHPKALKVYARYRPAKVTHYQSSTPDPDMEEGATDKGQVFIALTTKVYQVDTNSKQYFDPENDCVLAYGEITWNDDFGPEDGLKEQKIEIKYKDAAKTTPATHLIIVGSASKYGDYFTGAVGSILYLDDFELVY